MGLGLGPELTPLDVERGEVDAGVRDAAVLKQVVGDLAGDELVQVLHGRGHKAAYDLVHHVRLPKSKGVRQSHHTDCMGMGSERQRWELGLLALPYLSPPPQPERSGDCLSHTCCLAS